MAKNKLKQNHNGQIFSTDIIVVIIIILFGALFLIMNQVSTQTEGDSIEEKYKVAQSESKLVVTNLKTNKIIDDDNTVNVEKLVLLSEEEIREDLNIKNKFCIVFEKDGKLVKIDPDTKIYGIGSSDILVNGVPCK